MTVLGRPSGGGPLVLPRLSLEKENAAIDVWTELRAAHESPHAAPSDVPDRSLELLGDGVFHTLANVVNELLLAGFGERLLHRRGALLHDRQHDIVEQMCPSLRRPAAVMRGVDPNDRV